MASTSFRIIEHVVPSQYIREYPRAIAIEQEETLKLSVKQYIPIDNPNPQRGDVTIIGAHANAFPKVRRLSIFPSVYACHNIIYVACSFEKVSQQNSNAFVYIGII